MTRFLATPRLSCILILIVGLAWSWPAAADPPTNVNATPGNGQVTLTWEAPAVDSDETIEGYHVYRDTAFFPSGNPEDAPGQRVTSQPVSSSSFVDAVVTNGTTYFYRVTALIQEDGEASEETDLSSGSAGIDFATPGVPPVIEIEAPEPALRPEAVDEEDEVKVEVEIASARPLASVRLHLRQGGEVAFTTQAMPGDGEDFELELPGSVLTSRGVEYFITAVDTSGLGSRVPETGVISLPVRTRGASFSQGGGSSQTAFRMITFPTNLEGSTAEDLLWNDLGPYDTDAWRLFGIRGAFSSAEGYDELRDRGAPLGLANAFWLITSTPVTISTGPGTSLRTDAPFELPLQAGWNLIGLPYTFPLPIEQLSVTNTSGALNDVFGYTGQFEPVEPGDALQPFQGYLVRLSDGGTGTLIIDPDRTPPAEDAAALEAKQEEEALDWQIRIAAQVQDARDTFNVAAVAPTARRGYDALDRFNPPPIGDYVSVYFPHEDWGDYAGPYRRDVRPTGEAPYEWHLEVRSSIPDVVTLSFDELTSVPEAYDVWLLDDRLDVAHNLRARPTYRVVAPPDGRPQSLRMVVGHPSDMAALVGAAAEAPPEVMLQPPYPNPRAGEVPLTIPFGLPEAGPVTLRIYDTLGRHVATVLRETREAGTHSAVWDGRDATGTVLPSGTYILQLTAAGQSVSQRVVLLR